MTFAAASLVLGATLGLLGLVVLLIATVVTAVAELTGLDLVPVRTSTVRTATTDEARS